jgi:hypothetical protein
MKQQLLEAKLARIEAVARDAVLKQDSSRLMALMTIIQIAEKEKSLIP